MPKKYRHHRQINRPKEPQPTIVVEPSVLATDNLSIWSDLKRNIIITAILFISLVILTLANAKTGWALTAGTHLNQLLNIQSAK